MTEPLEQVFARCFDAHADELFRFAYYRIGAREEAEDLVSESFLQLWSRLQAEPVANPRALLYTIVRGRIIDRYRTRGRRGTDIPLEDATEPVFEDGTALQIDVRLDYARVEEALRGLRPEYAEVILLHYVHELSVAEVSDILGETENNVRVRMHRALGRLKDTLL
jgi:RNA polymerase sigma-70 factor (ECF subfamily)